MFCVASIAAAVNPPHLNTWSLMMGYSPVMTLWTYVVNHSTKQEPGNAGTPHIQSGAILRASTFIAQCFLLSYAYNLQDLSLAAFYVLR